MKRLKKIIKRVFILLIIGGALYGFYAYASTPAGFISKDTLVESYFTSLDETTVCDRHFNEETQTVCDVIKAELENETITVSEIVDISGSDAVEVTLASDGHSETFIVSFKTVNESGIKGLIHDQYYIIDTIQ
ncbi:MAG: hypothetical protein UMR38_08055 [Candidatus Izemoplasma sp.]|nr:hypothetical protein [Candidatus Izemoplasma sp.]